MGTRTIRNLILVSLPNSAQLAVKSTFVPSCKELILELMLKLKILRCVPYSKQTDNANWHWGISANNPQIGPSVVTLIFVHNMILRRTISTTPIQAFLCLNLFYADVHGALGQFSPANSAWPTHRGTIPRRNKFFVSFTKGLQTLVVQRNDFL